MAGLGQQEFDAGDEQDAREDQAELPGDGVTASPQRAEQTAQEYGGNHPW